jgi:hypothetical protein
MFQKELTGESIFSNFQEQRHQDYSTECKETHTSETFNTTEFIGEEYEDFKETFG